MLICKPTIVLSDRIGDLSIDVGGGKVLCVHHHAYPVPNVSGADVLTFAEFKKGFAGYLKDCAAIVMVGLNKIITPSSRTDEVFPVLYRQSHNILRVSVDRTLFDADPWRAYFHFGFVGADYAGFPYSYAAERQYINWIDGYREENLFSSEVMVKHSRGVARSTYAKYFEPMQIARVSMPSDVHDEYQELKAHCFEHMGTPKAIIKALADFAQKHCTQRKVPTPGDLFRIRSKAAADLLPPCGPSVVMTDLKVDEYLVSRLAESIELTNAVAEACHG